MSDLITKCLQRALIECPDALGIIIDLYPETLDYVDSYGNTWLIIASRTNPMSLLKILNSDHCTPEYVQKTNYNKENAFLTSCQYQPLSVKYLLESDKCNVNTVAHTNAYGETCLMIASKYQKSALEYLVKSAKCDTELFEKQNKFNMETVLFYNCDNSDTSYDTFKIIMNSSKASTKLLESVNTCGQSVLYRASRNQCFQTVKYILTHDKCTSEFVSQHRFSKIHRGIFGNKICDLICGSEKYHDSNENILIDKQMFINQDETDIKNNVLPNNSKQFSFTDLETNIKRAKLEIEKMRLELKLKSLTNS